MADYLHKKDPAGFRENGAGFTEKGKDCPDSRQTEALSHGKHEKPSVHSFNESKIQTDCAFSSRRREDNDSNMGERSNVSVAQATKPEPEKQINELFFEKKRLETYYSEHIWPKSHCITAEELANSGFYYLGNLDRVRCAWCEGVLREWSAGDRAMEEHEYHFPECAFIQNIDGCGNVLINPLNRPTRINNSSAIGPRHPQYSTYDARMKTYDCWPKDKPQTPHALSQAGFFYAGREDYVRCFTCDGGLRYWSDEDNVWTEHARWFPHCEFLKENKGEAYIQSVRNQSSEKFQQQSTGEPPPEINQVMSKQAAQRMARSRMDTPRVKLVIDLGYDTDIVRKAIERKLERTGDDFEDASTLMNAVLDLQEQESKAAMKSAVVLSSNVSGTTCHTSTTSPTKTSIKTSTTSPTKTTVKTSTTPSTNTTTFTKTSSQAKSSTPGKSTAPSSEESSVDLQALKLQVEEMKQNSTCKICMDKPTSMVFIPCGHYIACTTCADAFRECPMCRCTIRGRVRAYMS